MQAVIQGIIKGAPKTKTIAGKEYTWATLSIFHPKTKDDTEQKITNMLLEYESDIKLNNGDKVRVYGHFNHYEERGEDKLKLLVSEYEIIGAPLHQEKQKTKQEEQLTLF